MIWQVPYRQAGFMTGTLVFNSWRDRIAVEIGHTPPEVCLQRWLEGKSLPPLDNYTEGHGWLLEAIKDLPTVRKPLTEAAVQLLRLFSHGGLKSYDLNRLLFNLFYFSAGLRQPDLLWLPLLRILEMGSVSANDLHLRHYRGIALTTPFRAALAENQGDATLAKLWLDMLAKLPHKILGGMPMDGFEGVLGLPGPPDEDVIGWSLARMADDLEKSPFRKDQFLELIDYVEARFPQHNWDFIFLSIVCEWKGWTQELVGDPAKVIKIEYGSNQEPEYVEEEGRRKIRIRLPESLVRYADEIEPNVRRIALDFRRTQLPQRHLLSQLRHLFKKRRRH